MIEFSGNRCKIITMNNTQGANTVTSKLYEQVTDAINLVKKHAADGIRDDIHYSSITDCFENSNKNIFGRAFSFSIEQDANDSAEHILRVSLLHPNLDMQTTRPLAIGNKEQILGYLNDAQTAEKIKNQLLAMSKTLEMK